MRLSSTVESTEKGDYSFLAIIESLLAVAVSLWFAWEYQTITHLIIASCLAPLLLLRTEESTQKGLSLFNSSFGYLIDGKYKFIFYFVGIVLGSLIVGFIYGKETMLIWAILGITGILFYYLEVKGKMNIGKMPFVLKGIVGVVGVGGVLGGAVVIVIIMSLISKLWATIIVCFASPWECVKAIPVNWSRIVFSVDMRRSPEIIPGIESKRYKAITQHIADLRFGESMNDGVKKIHENGFLKKAMGLLVLSFTFILYFPAFAYRWSLKSSSLVWLPLIYIIGAKDEKCDEKDNNKRLQIILDRFRNSMWAKLLLAYNLIVLIFFTLLPVVMAGKASLVLKSFEANQKWITVLDSPFMQYFFIFNLHFDLWHVTRFLTAFFSLALFFYADRLLLARKVIPDYGLKSAPYIIRTGYHLLIIPFSLFTIACGLYLLLLPINWYSILEKMQIYPF